MVEQAMNRDWRTLPIVPPHATAGEQLKYRLEAAGKKFTPIATQQRLQSPKEGSKISLPERFMGFGPAGKYLQDRPGYDKFSTDTEQRLWEQKERQDNKARRERGLPTAAATQGATYEQAAAARAAVARPKTTSN